jgi:hypothetical protein
MTDTQTDPAAQLAALQAQVDKLLAAQAAQAATAAEAIPHHGILNGVDPRTVLGPMGADGRVLPGQWDTVTGHWVDPETAAAQESQRATDEASRVQAAKDQVAAENREKALAIARQELAAEQDLADQVAAAKAELVAQATGTQAPDAAPSPFGTPPAG